MVTYRPYLRFGFLFLVATAGFSIIVIISQGYIDKPFNAIANWHFRLSSSFEVDNKNITKVCHNKAMKNVLLIISYVDITVEKIAAINNLYSDRFPNILFCGSKTLEISSKAKILVLHLLRGMTAYSCVAGAIQSYPNYKGYLFIKSDVLVNFWRLSELDITRIWQTPTLSGQAMFEQSRDPWIWWYTPWGLKACEKAYKRIIFLNSLNKKMSKNINDVDSKTTWEIENSLNALLWNGRGRYLCYRSDANIFYIPSKYANEFEKMSRIFADYRVFMDIAVSTIIAMLELKEKNVILSGEDLGMIFGEERVTWDTKLFLERLNSSFSFMRPLFSAKTGRYQNLVKILQHKLDDNEACALYD